MGFHLFDIVIIVAIGMLIFGPQALQKWARGAGKSMKQVNALKDQVLSELPLNELSEMSRQIPRIPTNPLQVTQMLLSSQPEQKQSEKAEESPAKE